MNMSTVASSLKMQLGLYGLTLPFKDPVTNQPIPTENVIMDVLKTMTIPRYSQFVPWIREGTINIKSLKCIDHTEGIYLLPNILTITPVMYVADVSMPFKNNKGAYGDVFPPYGVNRTAQGVYTANAYLMLAGQMRNEPTFEYLGSNKIKLYGFPSSEVTIRVACQHEVNGETIEDSCYDSFMQLAELDTKIFLYNSLKLYDGIPTAFGNINLKIDEWQSAESERNSLLETWRDTFHLDMDFEEFM